jgi:hypothetical protein
MGDPEEHKDEELTVKADTPKEEGPKTEEKEPEKDPIRHNGEDDQPEVA